MIARILRPFRQRRAVEALAAYSEASDAHRRAVVTGDTRLQHQTLKAKRDAMNARLKAENDLARAR